MFDRQTLSSFSKRKILVTGGTGLVGRQVVRILSEAGAKVRSASLDQLKVPEGVEKIFGDLSDFKFCKEITQGMDDVFHVAGVKGSPQVTDTHPASFFIPLLMMNTNLLEACRLNDVKRVVYTSSIGAYPQAEIFRESEEMDHEPPMDKFPGWAKRMAEFQVRAYRIQYDLRNFSIVRLCNVYGPGDNFDPKTAMVIPSLMHRIYQKEDPVMIWGDGSPVRDFVYSEDAAKGIILALYHGTNSRYVNLGSGKGCSIKELVETLQQLTPFNYKFDTTKHSGYSRRVMDISLARKMVGYEPETSLLEGLKRTWEWYVGHQKEYLNRKNYFTEESHAGNLKNKT